MNSQREIVEIRGSRDYCDIYFKDGAKLRCWGELLQDRFAIYKSSLVKHGVNVSTLDSLLKKHIAKNNGFNITIE